MTTTADILTTESRRVLDAPMHPNTQHPERPREVLGYICRFLDEFGYPPTLREIGHACDISSTSMVSYYLDRLAADGYIERDPVVSRGLRVTDAGRDEITQEGGAS